MVFDTSQVTKNAATEKDVATMKNAAVTLSETMSATKPLADLNFLITDF